MDDRGNNFWKRYSTYLQIVVAVFTAGCAWAGVMAQGEKIAVIEVDQRQLAAVVIDLRISQARTEEGVKEILRQLRKQRQADDDE